MTIHPKAQPITEKETARAVNGTKVSVTIHPKAQPITLKKTTRAVKDAKSPSQPQYWWLFTQRLNQSPRRKRREQRKELNWRLQPTKILVTVHPKAQPITEKLRRAGAVKDAKGRGTKTSVTIQPITNKLNQSPISKWREQWKKLKAATVLRLRFTSNKIHFYLFLFQGKN